MTKQTHIAEPPATKFLRRHRIAFEEYPYDYVDHGGAMEAARQLGLDAHAVAKTLIMEDETTHPLIVLMHGDHDVSTKNPIGRASCRERVCQYVLLSVVAV